MTLNLRQPEQTIITDSNVKTHSWYIIIIVVIVLLFGLRELWNRNQADDLVKSITTYSDSAKFERLKNGALVSYNTSLQLQTQSQLRTMASNLNDTVKQMIKEFKSLSNVTRVTNNFFAGKDTIKYETKIPCSFPPFKVRRGTPKTYQLVGTIGQDYFAVDSLAIADSMTLVFGRKKMGFMKYDYGVAVNHSNPLIVSKNILDYKYTPEKKWFERTWVHMVVGAAISSGGATLFNTFIKK